MLPQCLKSPPCNSTSSTPRTLQSSHLTTHPNSERGVHLVWEDIRLVWEHPRLVWEDPPNPVPGWFNPVPGWFNPFPGWFSPFPGWFNPFPEVSRPRSRSRSESNLFPIFRLGVPKINCRGDAGRGALAGNNCATLHRAASCARYCGQELGSIVGLHVDDDLLGH